MASIKKLKTQRESIKKQICQNLDLVLIGSVVRSPAMMNYSLTTKVNGKTVTKYVRQGLVSKAKEMTLRNKETRELLQQLSAVNWELLKLESKK